MIITTAAFLELSTHAQHAIILDGILRVKAEIFQLTTNLSKLNGWMATMDLVQADVDCIARYERLEKQLNENIDALTEQILIEQQKARHLAVQIQQRKQNATPKPV